MEPLDSRLRFCVGVAYSSVWVTIHKNKNDLDGSRVLERLMEHGTEDQMCTLVDQCIELAEELSRHPFGIFFIQSLLEHGAQHRRETIVQQLLPFVPKLAVHRTARHVVQKTLNYSDEAGRVAIAQKLLSAQSPSLEEVADSRYGSYVVEELRNIFGLEGPGADVQIRLEHALPELRHSPFFARVAGTFGLLREGVAPAADGGVV